MTSTATPSTAPAQPPAPRSRRALVAVGVAAVVLVAAVIGGWVVLRDDPAPTEPGLSAVDQRDPELQPGVPPSAAPRLTAPPAAGTVDLRPGPFTDRVRIDGLRLVPGTAPVVTGRLSVTTDVSDLISLELVADFYDRTGRLVGSTRTAYGDAERPHIEGEDESVAFRLAAPAGAGTAVFAVLSIPSLVNE